MLSDYLWVVFAVLMILIVLYYILGLLVPSVQQPTKVLVQGPVPVSLPKTKQQFYAASSPASFDQLGARNVQDRYQLVM